MVEGAALEMLCPERDLGFESLTLRQKAVYPHLAVRISLAAFFLEECFMDSYAELNTRLVEAFGDLEHLCNQIYDPPHAVTTYINIMESCQTQGKRSVPQWDYDFSMLKQIRHKRNKLSHGEISFKQHYAEEQDIDFAINFRNRIMNQTDPLTLYHRSSKSQSIAKQNYIPTQNTPPKRLSYNSGKSLQKSAGCATFLFMLIIFTIVGVWLIL